LLGQYIFALLYVLVVGLVARIYQRSGAVPNWVVLLICVSRRVHSIFVLRLFNDGIAMLLFYVAMLLLIERRYFLANVWFSLAVGIKMNILLFAPAWGLVLIRAKGFWGTLPYLALCAAVQVILALPFLTTFPVEYMNGAFEFGRVFKYIWSVNWKVRLALSTGFPSRCFFVHWYNAVLLAMCAVHSRSCIFIQALGTRDSWGSPALFARISQFGVQGRRRLPWLRSPSPLFINVVSCCAVGTLHHHCFICRQFYWRHVCAVVALPVLFVVLF
jgi:alpha-1,3-mannosyltransferase